MNNYEKQGYKNLYKEQYHLLQLLDSFAIAYNRIWEQKYDESINELIANIDLLPMKSSDQPNQKAKLFESASISKEMRQLLINVVMAIGKLVRHMHYKVSNETARFQEQSKNAELKYKKLDDLKEMLNRLVFYLELIKSSGYLINSNQQDLIHQISDTATEIKKIQIEVA